MSDRCAGRCHKSSHQIWTSPDSWMQWCFSLRATSNTFACSALAHVPLCCRKHSSHGLIMAGLQNVSFQDEARWLIGSKEWWLASLPLNVRHRMSDFLCSLNMPYRVVVDCHKQRFQKSGFGGPCSIKSFFFQKSHHLSSQIELSGHFRHSLGWCLDLFFWSIQVASIYVEVFRV